MDGAEADAVRTVTTALHEVAQQVERHRAGLAVELGLGSTDVVAMWEIARRPGLRPSDLARALGLGVAGTSSVIDKLARTGFVRREADPNDRRSVNLALTPAGRHAQAWTAEQLDRVVGGAFGDELDPALAGQVLRRLADRFTATA